MIREYFFISLPHPFLSLALLSAWMRVIESSSLLLVSCPHQFFVYFLIPLVFHHRTRFQRVTEDCYEALERWEEKITRRKESPSRSYENVSSKVGSRLTDDMDMIWWKERNDEMWMRRLSGERWRRSTDQQWKGERRTEYEGGMIITKDRMKNWSRF